MKIGWRPFPVALLLGLVSETLFLIHLSRPSVVIFDEVHYVRAARVLQRLAGPTNIEHPMLGKECIALGMALFGDDAFGWRFFSTIAGSAVVMGLFAIGWLSFGRMRPAVAGAVLAVLNFTLFVQARIAMLDGYMAAFVVLGIAAMLWAMRAPVGRAGWQIALAGVLLGLAVGAKWTALPYIGFAGIAWLVRRPTLSSIKGVAILGATSLAAYLLTFAPAFFYASDPLTLRTLLPFQAEMFAQQIQVLPAHVYQSRWWSWPLMLRPIWYFYENADGALRGILLVGNPLVMWGGLIAVAACLWDRSPRSRAIAALWLSSWLMWAIIPKSLGFFYYYYLSTLFLPLVLAAALDRFGRKHWDEWFTVASFALFAFFYPILSGGALADGGAFHRWTWFTSWI